jgi:hypothetical protein
MFGSDLPHTLTVGGARPDVTSRLGRANFQFRILLRTQPHHGALISGDLSVESDGSPLKLGNSLRSAETAGTVSWFRQFAADQLRDGQPSTTGLAHAPRPTGTDQTSPVPLPVGTKCRDGSAVIGKDGNLFIYGGSNALWQRYGEAESAVDSARTQDEISGWVELLAERARNISGRGATFAQTIVPEKSTSFHSGVPRLAGVTRALAGIEESLLAEPWYVSGRQSIPTGSEPSSWLKLDSHLSPVGAFALSRSLLEVVAPSAAIPAFELSAVESLDGDLSARFFGQVVAEAVAAPRSRDLDHLGSSARLIRSTEPDRGGRFVGLQRVWINESAPLDLRSVVFGNSFFGGNPRSASRCNYWFLRMFREHHFVWSPDLDYTYLDATTPDVVVCQTNERFLSTVPQR